MALHGKLCQGDHHHRPIAGQTRVQGKSMPLSQWTELYPQKFAKQVAKIMLHDQGQLCPSFAADADDHPTKKRRLGQKMSPQEIATRFSNSSDINWQTAMQLADRSAPRVGTLVVQQGEIIDMIKTICPQHDIKHVVLCRGTDRYVGPNVHIPRGFAPLRRQVCIQRKTEVVHADEWEPWEHLSNRGLRKKGISARVSMTIFAAAKTTNHAALRRLLESRSAGDEEPHPKRPCMNSRERESAPESHANARTLPIIPSSNHHHLNIHNQNNPPISIPNNPDTDNTQALAGEPNKTSETGSELSEVPRHVIDLASHKHGPEFLKLNQEEQSWLLKLHRNSGHPGRAKLTEFCRQLQCPDHLVRAISDIRCSTCQETKGPVISRPSALHENCDFGDIVSMDAVTWTNSQGSQFHFYHFLDQSTLFNTAVIAPAHSTEHACRALHTGWFNWAGPPGMLCVDAGTEMNSEEFSNYLQRHSVKCRTCAAEAHWQNARTERRGGIIQLMLNKIDIEQPITNYDQMSTALSHVTSTKNQWSRHRGYPPEMLVFGKGVRVPGSITSDPTVAAHATALSPLPDGARFRQELAIREAARKSFAMVDNDQTLRRAIVHRSRPHRGFYEKGEWVMMWKKRGESEGSWIGPMQVIIQEGQNVVWVTRHHKLYRIAPEHLRSLSAMEEFSQKTNPETTSTHPRQTIMPSRGGVQFHDTISTRHHDNGPVGNNLSNASIPTLPGDARVEAIPAPVAAPATSQEVMRPAPSTSEQPDVEPEIQSIPSSGSDMNNPQHDQTEVPNPIEVPVPDSSDDDSLYIEDEPLYHVQQDQVLRFEVNINQRDIENWREETRPQEMAFLVSAAKRQRSEVKISQLSPKERQMFEEAKMKEIESWLSTETVSKILRHQVPKEQILRCRWILTWKEIDDTSKGSQQMVDGSKPNTRKPKARLVVLGFEDPLVDQIPRDSPTMSKLSRVLILQHAASLGWDIHSFDIKTAFLRGTERNPRLLGMEPPEEMRRKMNLKPEEVVQLLKGAYGRVDAPFLWFQELRQSLLDLGFSQAPFDPCCFVLRGHDQKPEGLLGIHVDDGLCAGSKRFHEKLTLLEKKYPFGSHKSREFTFTGLKICQKIDQSIWVDQEQYVKDIHPIQIQKDRKQQTLEPVNEAERQGLRALIGSLQYAAVNTRPDLCSRLGWLQSQINRAVVGTLIEGNKILHEAKMNADVTIKFQPIPVEDIRFIAFSDASFASAKVPDSHQGMLVMAGHKNISTNQNSPVNPLVWHSKKIQKVVVSTLSAEAMSLAGAVDTLAWIRLYWAWIRDGKCQWQKADETLMQLPPAFAAIPPEDDSKSSQPPEAVQDALSKLPQTIKSIITTDCKSLFDLISRQAPPSCQEFRTLLQAKLIKEHLNNGVSIRWVPSQAQLADALTKIMDSSVLRECLKRGRYSLHDEDEILRARSDSRARLQWLRNMSDGSKGNDSEGGKAKTSTL